MNTSGLPFWLRRWIELALVSTSLHALPDVETEWPDYFDNTEGIGEVRRELFYKDKRSGVLLPYKGRATPVPIEKKIGVEAHITAVAFGTSKRARRFWANAIADGLVPDWRRWGATPEAAARRMALHQRFWRVPYHWVALLNGDVLHNNQITRRTYHGHGGNGPLIGVSLEGSYPGLEKMRRPKHNGYDAHTIETGRAGIRLAVTEGRNDGAPVERIYAHRQYSATRLGDPGEGWWKEIGIPISAELNLTRVVDFSHGSGNQICREWDPTGLVDYRGRPVGS